MSMRVIHGGRNGFVEPQDWENALARQKDGTFKKTYENARIILTLHPQWAGRIRLNEFSGHIMVRGGPFYGDNEVRQWQDVDYLKLVAWIDREACKEFPERTVAAGVSIVASENAYHPVRDYLNSLEWDGVERVDRFFTDCFGVSDNAVSRGVSRRWLVSGVARIYQPGCKADYLVVLEGAQGAGKSRGLRALFGDEWYSDSEIPLGSTDSYSMLRGKWGVEMAEFGSFSRSDQSKIKRYVTSPSDNYRAKYGRTNTDVCRQSLFCATTNDEHWNHDPTGARRYWPMRVGICSPALIAQIRGQVWAEAVSLYRAGEKWWVEPGEFADLMRVEQEARYEAHPWEETISHFVAAKTDGRVSAQEIFSHLGIEVCKRSTGDARVINSILARLGYQTPVIYRLPSGQVVKGRSRGTM